MGLVVAGGVEDEFAEELAGGGVDDSDVEVLDEQDDVGSAEADVAQSPGDAQGDGPVFGDLVGADPVMGTSGSAGSPRGLGPRVVDGLVWSGSGPRWPGTSPGCSEPQHCQHDQLACAELRWSR